MPFRYHLTAILDRIEDSQAVLKLENNQEITWPLEKLPENIKEGESLKLFVLTDELETKHKQGLAKDILNEILKN